MKKVQLLTVIIFFNLLSFAQDTSLTLYFKSGQTRLTSIQQNSIEKLQLRHVTKITFDTIGKASVIKKVSSKKAKTAPKKIKTENKTIAKKPVKTENKKVVKHTNKKLQPAAMRKVVVNVWYDKPVIDSIAPEEKKEAIVIVDKCNDDTTIYSESGAMIKINRCYYKKTKNCFKFNDYQSAVAVQQAGLRTVDERGNPIESGGMVDIGFCSDTCLKTPVIILLPVPKCLTQQSGLSRKPMTLWTLNKNNTWGNSKNKIEIVEYNGVKYYKIEVYCPGRFNCDRPGIARKKLKVKLKNGLKFKSATISYDCPLYSVNGKIKKRKKKAIFPYICPQVEPLISLEAYNKKGETFIINNKNINDYKRKRKLISRCKCYDRPKERFLGIFKIRQKYLYRKYKIFKKDCERTNNKNK